MQFQIEKNMYGYLIQDANFRQKIMEYWGKLNGLLEDKLHCMETKVNSLENKTVIHVSYRMIILRFI